MSEIRTWKIEKIKYQICDSNSYEIIPFASGPTLQKNEKVTAIDVSSARELYEALKKINEEELRSQRPGGGYSKSAQISYETLNKFKPIFEENNGKND